MYYKTKRRKYFYFTEAYFALYYFDQSRSKLRSSMRYINPPKQIINKIISITSK